MKLEQTVPKRRHIKFRRRGNHLEERIQITMNFQLDPDSERTLLTMTGTVQTFRAALPCLHAIRSSQAL